MEEDTRDKLTEKFFRKSYPTTLKKKIGQEVIGLLQLSKVQYLPNFNINSSILMSFMVIEKTV